MKSQQISNVADPTYLQDVVRVATRPEIPDIPEIPKMS
jgi:hypothetical protein